MSWFTRTPVEIDFTASADLAIQNWGRTAAASDAVVNLTPKGQQAIVLNVPQSEKAEILARISAWNGRGKLVIRTSGKTTGRSVQMTVKKVGDKYDVVVNR